MAEPEGLSDLPERIPIFPLPGALVLPRAKLPLNIFEPRYLDMVRDAMAGPCIIGMVQPVDVARGQWAPEIYGVGGAGRITAYRETDDGRYLITLTGLARFRIVEELKVDTKYRQVIAGWLDFAADLAPAEDVEIDRERLLTALQAYLALTKLQADWKTIEKAADAALVDNLAMACPFGISEKQALLEAPDTAERARVMTALIEMAVLQHADGRGEDDEDASPVVH